MKKILVIEDEIDILELISYNLEQNQFQVIKANRGEDGLRQARLEKPDLIILDLMLDGMDGLTVCRTLQKTNQTQSIPIIILTAQKDEDLTVSCFEAGATDYITKPFSPKILFARVDSLLKKSQKDSKVSIIKINELEIDIMKHQIKIMNQKKYFPPTEFEILTFLALHSGQIFTRDKIIDAVHGLDYAITPRTVDVQILNIRKRLGFKKNMIETIRGIGYRLNDE